MLSMLFIKAFNILIIVLNFQSGKSNIYAMSESGSDVCSVSSNFVLSCRTSFNFLLIARHDVLGKSNGCK